MSNRYCFLLLFLVFTLFCQLPAQPNIEWQATLGGSAEEIAYDVEQCLDGGYIVVGSARSEDGDISNNFNWRDFWVVKLTAMGELDWEASYGGSHHETAQDVLPTLDGGYIVVGQSSSEDGQVSGHQGSGDYWVLKLDAVGNIEWEQTYGGSGSEFGYAIEQATDGSYYMAGGSQSTNGDVSENRGGVDYWVIKISATGELLWERSYGGSRHDLAFALDATADGGCVVAGRSRSRDGDVTGNHGGANFVFDAWVIKLSDQGELEWERSLGGTDNDESYTIRQTTDGGYVLAGLTSSMDGDVTENPLGTDLWVVKLDENGEISWQNFFGGIAKDIAGEIQQTTDGGYVVTGCAGPAGDKRFWTLKLTSEGILDWQKSYGGSEDDRSFSIKQTNDEGFIVAGRTASSNGDVTGQNGGYDYWVVKLGACGVNTAVEVQEGGLQSLEVALSSTYQWLDCSSGAPVVGAHDAFFAPMLGGEYAVIVTNGSCVDTSACTNYCPLPEELTLTGEGALQVAEEVENLDIQWINCLTDSIVIGATGPLFTPTENGRYGAILSNENCSQTTECRYVCPQEVDVALSIQNDTLLALTDYDLATTYRWYNCSSGQFITQGSRPFYVPNQSGEYGVIVNQRGCASDTICIAFCKINNQLSESNGTLETTADQALSTFQWINCTDGSEIPSETDASFTPIISGDYALIVSQGACVDTSQCVSVCTIDTELVVTPDGIAAPSNMLANYEWINCETGLAMPGEAENIFTPTVSGQYAAIISDGVCTDTAACVTFCAIDTSLLVVGNTIYSLADTLTSTFQWYNCATGGFFPNEEASSFTPSTDGQYGVIIEQGSCFESSECVDFTLVGTKEQLGREFRIFPNPVQDVLVLQVNSQFAEVRYTIYDTNGGAVASGTTHTGSISIDTRRLPAGSYIIKMKSGSDQLTQRFVKL